MIHVLAVITTKPGKRAEVLAAFHANMPAVHAEAGCIEYGPVIDAPNSPAKVRRRHVRRGREVGKPGSFEGARCLPAHGGVRGENARAAGRPPDPHHAERLTLWRGWRIGAPSSAPEKGDDHGPEPVRGIPGAAGGNPRLHRARTGTSRRRSAAGASGRTRRRWTGRSCCWSTAMSAAPFRSSMAAAGKAPDVMEAAVIAAEFAAANIYAGLTNQGISMLVPTLLEVGTEEQKRAYVGPTIRGDIIWCQGYSEPGNGSDLANAQTKAELQGRVLGGERPENLDQFRPLRRHDVPAVPHRAGQAETRGPVLSSAVDGQSPGIDRRPLKTMTGRSEFNEVFFTDVKVPADPDRGRPRQGLVCRQRHAEARTLDDRQRRQGDHAAGTTDQAAAARPRSMACKLIRQAEFRDRLLRLQGEVIAWKAHNLRLLTEAAQGVDSGVKRMIVKYGGTMLGFRLSSLAVDALGAAGLPLNRPARTPKTTTPRPGTSITCTMSD